MGQITLSSVEQLALRLSRREQLALLEHLARGLGGDMSGTIPRDLYGAWQGRFPENFDLDAALRELRSAWQTRRDP